MYMPRLSAIAQSADLTANQLNPFTEDLKVRQLFGMEHVTSASPQNAGNMPLNIEFKARCPDPNQVRAILRRMDAELTGIDNQTDTYFNVPSGRLKLRDGNVERNLIYYERDAGGRPKQSDVWLAPCPEPVPLLELLTNALGVRVVVEKRREIYFHGSTKIHLDEVPGLGSFVEVEVIADAATADLENMRMVCDEWMRNLGVRDGDLVSASYSDLIASA